ncbi:hypothetical protein MKW94_004264, partial [Papaver nudicaule]|nr:hypothetical protein [Papaver nudicaule]
MSSSSESIYETLKGSHEYKITGYSLAKDILGVGKSMTSGRFTAGGSDWVIDFYPGGDLKANEEYISVYVKLVSPAEVVRASFELKLLDQSGGGKDGFCRSSTCLKTFSLNSGSASWYVC